jgi:hypothetical protein
MSEVHFIVKIDIADQEVFIQAARDRGYEDETDDFPEMIELVVINPDRPPLDKGYEIVRSTATKGAGETNYEIDFHLRITDQVAFIGEVRRCWNSCWGDNDYLPESLAEAGYEILVASNANPESPLDLGFEITGTKYYADMPLSHEVTTLYSDGENEPAVPGI